MIAIKPKGEEDISFDSFDSSEINIKEKPKKLINFHKKNEPKTEPYDVIIDITSIQKLNNPGWKISYHNNKKIEPENRIVVSVLGNSNRGKTYLLQKLSGNNLESGYQVQTKGLSMKFHGDIIYLDTAGTNVPLLVEKDEKRPNEEQINSIRLCQIITNYILQNFVIEYADILICVVGMLNSKEQIFLNKIKKLCEDKKKLIVIHNLVKCETCEDIEKYKNEVLLKMISCELIERPIPNFGDNKENLFNKFFIEKDNPHVKHFIFANDDKKKDIKKKDNLEKYNNTTLDYIRTCIKVERKKPKNLFENFLEHIKNISSNVLKNQVIPKIEGDYIKCNDKNIIPKEIRADELDNVIFIGKDYEPLYKFYRRGKYFVLEIQICSKKEDFEITVEHKFEKLTNNTEFKIIGKRNIKSSDDEDFLSNKRINFSNFKIETTVKLSDFDIKHISKKEVHTELKYGILFYIYEILN